MTDDRMALIELVEKQADGDLVRAMLAFANLQRRAKSLGYHLAPTCEPAGVS